jgi:hypothetical protein
VCAQVAGHGVGAKAGGSDDIRGPEALPLGGGQILGGEHLGGGHGWVTAGGVAPRCLAPMPYALRRRWIVDTVIPDSAKMALRMRPRVT